MQNKYKANESQMNQTDQNQTFYPKPTNHTYGSFRSEMMLQENESQCPRMKVSMSNSQTSDNKGDDQEVEDDEENPCGNDDDESNIEGEDEEQTP